MDDKNAAEIVCPVCSGLMETGWIAMWNPIVGTKVRWQPTKPGYRRLRAPEGAKVLLRARVGGRDPRVALYCSACATTVVPPDTAYD